jgi:hypothetical protein
MPLTDDSVAVRGSAAEVHDVVLCCVFGISYRHMGDASSACRAPANRSFLIGGRAFCPLAAKDLRCRDLDRAFAHITNLANAVKANIGDLRREVVSSS